MKSKLSVKIPVSAKALLSPQESELSEQERLKKALASVSDDLVKEKTVQSSIALPESLHKRYKVYLAKHGKKMKEHYIEMIQNIVDEDEQGDSLNDG